MVLTRVIDDQYWPDCRSDSVNVVSGVDWNETQTVCI